MSGGWVAGSVRAGALMRRRLGAGGARSLAASRGLDDAVQALAEGPYGHGVRVGMSLAEAEHGVAATLLWHLRVLAGWQPPAGGGLVRLLAGWFEIANVAEHVRQLTGESAAEPFQLGALSTAWSRLESTRSLGQLRAALAASPWGDPGAATAAAIDVGMHATWARRVAADVPDARTWAVGGLALLVARERFLAGRPLPAPVSKQAGALLGIGPLAAGSLPGFVDGLAPEARWALSGTTEPEQLWQAEADWFARVEHEGTALTWQSGFGPARVVGATAALAVDAWRVRAALQLAARGGQPLEVFDAVT